MEWKREPSFQTCTSTVYHFFFLEYSGAGNMSISIASQYPLLNLAFKSYFQGLQRCWSSKDKSEEIKSE